ncbi:MAG: hypothetical protein KGI27_08735 [Thaumarchaeota archaeon]|nr:hypothetical protein [Nitrososphaerota archaeon]
MLQKRIQTILFVAAALLFLCVNPALDAHAQVAQAGEQTVAVYGSAAEQVRPDTATVWFAVETTNKTAE